MACKLKIEWTNRQGTKLTKRLEIQEAKKRLTYLDNAEVHTQKWMPTDSGSVRFSYLAEAQAIRTALEKAGQLVSL